MSHEVIGALLPLAAISGLYVWPDVQSIGKGDPLMLQDMALKAAPFVIGLLLAYTFYNTLLVRSDFLLWIMLILICIGMFVWPKVYQMSRSRAYWLLGCILFLILSTGALILAEANPLPVVALGPVVVFLGSLMIVAYHDARGESVPSGTTDYAAIVNK